MYKGCAAAGIAYVGWRLTSSAFKRLAAVTTRNRRRKQELHNIWEGIAVRMHAQLSRAALGPLHAGGTECMICNVAAGEDTDHALAGQHKASSCALRAGGAASCQLNDAPAASTAGDGHAGPSARHRTAAAGAVTVVGRSMRVEVLAELRTRS